MRGALRRKLELRSQSNLYFALAFLPRSRREAFRDVYRFLRAADDVVDDPALDADEARAELQLWRDELDAIYEGRAQHRHAVRLAATVRRYRLDRALFDTILDALDEDAAPRSFATWDDLEDWCRRVSSTLGLLSLRLLDVDGDGPRTYAHHLGIALQLANILRDVGADAARGRVYLPLEALSRAGWTSADVLSRQWTPTFALLGHELAARIRSRIRDARAALTRAEARALLVPEIWADVYLALVDRLEAHDFEVLSSRTRLRKRTRFRIAVTRWAEPRILRRLRS